MNWFLSDNQWTGFYMIGASVINELNIDTLGELRLKQ